MPPGHLPRKTRPSANSQKHCTTGSGEPIGNTSSAPVIIPSTPMKRVSSPLRMAFSAVSTIPIASASRPGRLRSCAVTSRPLWVISSASATVRGLSRKFFTARIVARVESTVASAERTAPMIGRYCAKRGNSGRRARVATAR